MATSKDLTSAPSCEFPGNLCTLATMTLPKWSLYLNTRNYTEYKSSFHLLELPVSMATYSSCFMSLTPMALTRHDFMPKVSLGRLLWSTPSLSCTKNVSVKSSNRDPLSLDAEVQVLGTAGFHPSVWDDHFISASTSDLVKQTPATEGRVAELKKEVKRLLSLASNDSFQELDLIDKLQRLGVAYHFEIEIDDILKRMYDGDSHFIHQKVDDCADLNAVALRFRLLRQAGYYVSPDVFEKFKDGKSEFRSNLTSDVHCMLSLYQASYLSFNGEYIMDEALVFTTKHLKSMVTRLPPPIASEVQRNLDLPLRKSIERVEARQYISAYQADESRNESLLEFAKLDFNLVQSLHQKEIQEIKRWWDNMDIKSKLPFETRDRVVEGYAIIMSFYFEPKYTFGRILLAKIYGMLTVLDDVFDVYGDLEELEPLTDAFQRWDVGDVKDLKDHMKVIFLEVLNVINDADVDMIARGQFKSLLGLPYLKQEMKDYTKGLLEEAKILFSGDVPTLEEWLPIAIVTIAGNFLIVAAVMNLGEQIATKEVFDWISSNPKIIQCSYLICRLLDDIATFKLEEDRGIILSSVACCMKDHGISESAAIETLQKMVTGLWKDMNQEWLKPNQVPMCVLKIIFNWTRVLELYYADGDGYTNSKGRTK